MFYWEPEGCYRCTKSIAVMPFWFSADDLVWRHFPIWFLSILCAQLLSECLDADMLHSACLIDRPQSIPKLTTAILWLLGGLGGASFQGHFRGMGQLQTGLTTAVSNTVFCRLKGSPQTTTCQLDGPASQKFWQVLPIGSVHSGSLSSITSVISLSCG